MHYLVHIQPCKKPCSSLDPPPQEGFEAVNVPLHLAVQFRADGVLQGLTIGKEADLLDLLHDLWLGGVQLHVEVSTAGEGHLHIVWDGVPQLRVGYVQSAIDVHWRGGIDPPQVGVAL